jgi:phenylacetate-CoA ligase
VEAVLLGIPEVVPYYQIVVRREGTLDEAELKVEVSEDFFREIGEKALSDEVIEADHRLRALKEKVAHKIKDTIGVSMRVTLLAPGQAPRSEGGKLRRVLDLRK